MHVYIYCEYLLIYMYMYEYRYIYIKNILRYWILLQRNVVQGDVAAPSLLWKDGLRSLALPNLPIRPPERIAQRKLSSTKKWAIRYRLSGFGSTFHVFHILPSYGVINPVAFGHVEAVEASWGLVTGDWRRYVWEPAARRTSTKWPGGDWDWLRDATGKGVVNHWSF